VFIYLYQLYYCRPARLVVPSKNERESKSKGLQQEIKSASQGHCTSSDEIKDTRHEEPSGVTTCWALSKY
jgi:hypothetical protein